MTLRYQNHIGGRAVEAKSGCVMETNARTKPRSGGVFAPSDTRRPEVNLLRYEPMDDHDRQPPTSHLQRINP